MPVPTGEASETEAEDCHRAWKDAHSRIFWGVFLGLICVCTRSMEFFLVSSKHQFHLIFVLSVFVSLCPAFVWPLHVLLFVSLCLVILVSRGGEEGTNNQTKVPNYLYPFEPPCVQAMPQGMFQKQRLL